MLDKEGYRCCQCGTDKEENTEYYQVKIITSDGQMFFVPCCCKECAQKVKLNNENLHLKRYKDITDQSIQKILWRD